MNKCIILNQHLSNIIIGVISGIISGFIVSLVFYIKSKNEKIRTEIQSDYKRLLDYLFGIEYELRSYLKSFSQEYKMEIYRNIKKIINLKPRFDSFSKVKYQTHEFNSVKNEIMIFLSDFNYELVKGIKSEKKREYLVEVKDTVWSYIEKLLNIQSVIK